MDDLIKNIISEEIDLRKETEIDEIVDGKGNIMTSKKPTDLNTKGITQKKTTDQVEKSAYGQSGAVGIGVTGSNRTLRNYGEADLSKSLGFKKTMAKDKNKDEAESYFKKELGLDDTEADEKLDQMGYDKDLPEDKVRLVENPKKFIEEYLEQIVNKSDDNEIINSVTELPNILKKQLTVIKKHIKNNGIKISDIVKFLKDE